MGRKENLSSECAWRRRLARFRRWNRTTAEFCRQEGVSSASFYRWRKHLEAVQEVAEQARQSGKGASRSRGSAEFVSVSVSAAVMAEVEFANGVRIRVPATNVEALRAAVLAGGDLCKEVGQC